MCDRSINGYIIEGADQQGKTTIVKNICENSKRRSYKFGVPNKDFDFFKSYIDPFINNNYTVYDRSFVSEVVYSRVIPNRKVRVERFKDLVDFFKNNNFVFLFVERSDHVWEDREEEFEEKFNNSLKKEFREVFNMMSCEKYFLDPSDEIDKRTIENITTSMFSKRRLLQEIYRFDVWKMVVSCMFLNRTHRDDFDKIRCDFFFKYKDPVSFLSSDESEIKEMISFLGFKNRRYNMIKNFSEDFLKGVELKDCRGVGQYVKDSFDIFCKCDYNISPKDKKLLEYLEWIKRY